MDASLNNYVALHYASRHMSWLHCMWGVGASVGPYVMGIALTGGRGWQMGYRWISFLQIALTAILLASLRLWKKRPGQEGGEEPEKPLGLRQVLAVGGVREVMLTFFCYCGIEQTAGLWASSYLVLNRGVDAQTAAGFASMFFLGITIGRGLSGFITMKLNDKQMVRLGCGIIAVGAAALLLPLGEGAALAGLVLVGLGCAPVYPCLIHSTPEHFGAQRSQAIIGVQMASAYVGTCLMPPLFGILAEHVGIWLFPIDLGILLAVMTVSHEALIKRTAA